LDRLDSHHVPLRDSLSARWVRVILLTSLSYVADRSTPPPHPTRGSSHLRVPEFVQPIKEKLDADLPLSATSQEPDPATNARAVPVYASTVSPKISSNCI